jgi:pimeloyl-ACP methyl ester carboxylesterase
VAEEIERAHEGLAVLEFTIDETIAEGNRVAVRTTITGRHEGEFMGAPPTGEHVEFRDEFATLQNDVLDWYGVEATQRYVDLDRPVMQAHVLEAGDGQPVVFIHGGGDEAMIWALLLARMQGNFAVYAPDRPGCGLSDHFTYGDTDLRRHASDFVCSVLDALGLERADVVACSAGGLFAFAAALDRPERFRRLVFAGYPLGIVHSAPLPLRLVGSLPGFGRLFELMQSRQDAEDLREFYDDEFNADLSTFPDSYFEAKYASLQLPGAVESFTSFLKATMSLRGLSPAADLTEEVTSLEVPSLFLWGEHDLAPPAEGRDAVASIPDATFEVVDGAGHFPFHDAPDWTADRITTFLQDAPRGDGESEQDNMT